MAGREFDSKGKSDEEGAWLGVLSFDSIDKRSIFFLVAASSREREKNVGRIRK